MALFGWPRERCTRRSPGKLVERWPGGSGVSGVFRWRAIRTSRDWPVSVSPRDVGHGLHSGMAGRFVLALVLDMVLSDLIEQWKWVSAPRGSAVS